MIIDRYLKIVLTVIAISLAVIATSQLINSAYAAMDYSDYKMIDENLRGIIYAIQGCN